MSRVRSKKKTKSQKKPFGLPGWLTLAGLVGLATLMYTYYREEQAKIPRLSVDVGWQPAYVGDGKGVIPPRIDNVVTVPIAVYHNSGDPALNLELNLLMSDGSGREIDLNQALRKDGQGTNRLGRLDQSAPWRLSIAPSVNPNREQYQSGAFNCKIAVQLTWEDTQGRAYSQVTLAQLRYSKAVERYPERFFWERVASYSSYSSRKDRDLLRKHLGLPVKF